MKEAIFRRIKRREAEARDLVRRAESLNFQVNNYSNAEERAAIQRQYEIIDAKILRLIRRYYRS